MVRTIDAGADRPTASRTIAVVAARNEAERVGATLRGLADALPGVRVWVADDGSSDATAAIARAAGAQVSSGGRTGKGAAMTRAATLALAEGDATTATVFLLCDGDLGASAARLGPLAAAVAVGEADVAVGGFAVRGGGGFGIALGFARWAIERRCGLILRAPISGQRALSAAALRDVLPFAPGFGMEIGITVDAVRAGHRVAELELELSHRVEGRTLAGFAHRGRQLADFARVYLTRGRRRGRLARDAR